MLDNNANHPQHAFIQCDLAPIYIIRPLNNSETDITASLKALEDHWQQSTEPFVLIIDTTTAPPPTPRGRQLITEHDLRLQEYKRIYCRGTAYVITSTLARGALQAILWMSPPKYPVETFTCLEDAIAWGKTQMQRPLEQVS